MSYYLARVAGSGILTTTTTTTTKPYPTKWGQHLAY